MFIRSGGSAGTHVFLSDSFTGQFKLGEELFPEEIGPNKLMVKWAAAEAALKELQKRGPLPEKVREGLKESDD